ncbi:hypothetical protein KIN20_028264 [Parelaphostrongylus tenuis]|uniref:Uncharacterized protein n=1 Tax=Parelaphostrongylus tenuis TaxID=148309 RepID=A0AAD5R1A3_PARTN|nr:hypothetical protein KIN20_028264 [Parelaphostrongylus tenuis]
MESFKNVYSLLRMQKSKRELILSALPHIEEYSSLHKLLNDIPKNDGTSPVEELLCFIRRQMSVYNKLMEYDRLEGKSVNTWESHFNQNVKQVLKTHWCIGEEIHICSMGIGEFFTIIDCKNLSDSELLRFGEFVFAPVLSGKVGVEEFEKAVLENLPFDKVYQGLLNNLVSL